MTRFIKPLRELLVLVLIGAALTASAEQEQRYFDNDALRDRYEQLIWELRCPKCQNQNIAGSNAPIAADMRDKTYELLHQGYSDAQIIDYMIERYSEFVTYKPRVTWGTVWLWLIPGAGLLTGALVVLWLARRSASQPAAPISAAERQRLNELLQRESDES
ncbi:cytochrome c-type biogenesis protein [Saccharospirillum mangrovi]|uniref:cytochrome c-type biogenesis protein n=1 Tax=Saccharospirillum mangrovi TaxID=2161747 RepID=UPI0018E54D67|nr:cytochrome c-type biogenesis protein [Saccharospirillum mangrovi]